jgi:hypothetical protein
MTSTRNEQSPDDDKGKKEAEIPPEVRLFFKVGGYFGWTWEQFNRTPWWVIKQLSRLLDEKEADMNQFVSYEESAMFKNLKRMFPPDK